MSSFIVRMLKINLLFPCSEIRINLHRCRVKALSDDIGTRGGGRWGECGMIRSILPP